MRQRGSDLPQQRGLEDDAKGLRKGQDADSLFPFLPGGRRTELMAVIIVLLLFLIVMTGMGSSDSDEPDDDFMTPAPALLHSAHEHSAHDPQPLPLPNQVGGQYPHQPGVGNRHGRGRIPPLDDRAAGPSNPDLPPLDNGLDADADPDGNTDGENPADDDQDPDLPPLDGDMGGSETGNYVQSRRGRPHADGRRHKDPSLSLPGLDDREYRRGRDDDPEDAHGDLDIMDELDKEMGELGGELDGEDDDDEDEIDPDGELDEEPDGSENEDDAAMDREEKEMEREMAMMEKGMMGDGAGALGDVVDGVGEKMENLMENLGDGEFMHHEDSESEPDEMELEEMADLMFNEMDVSPQDNMVSWPEWQALVSRDMPDFDDNDERNTFETVDKNNDGYIDRGELREDWKREDLQFLSKDGFDNDDDGFPDRENGIAMPGRPPADDTDASQPLMESNGPLRQPDQPLEMPGAPPQAEGAAPKSLGKTIVESALKLFKARAPRPHTLSVKLFQAKSATWAQASAKCAEDNQRLCPLTVVSQLRLCQDQDPHHRSMWTPLSEQDEWIELSTCNVNRMPESYKLQSLVACC